MRTKSQGTKGRIGYARYKVSSLPMKQNNVIWKKTYYLGMCIVISRETTNFLKKYNWYTNGEYKIESYKMLS